jgi:hypothetical protein
VIYAFLRHADGKKSKEKSREKERKKEKKKAKEKEPRTLMGRMLSLGNNKE